MLQDQHGAYGVYFEGLQNVFVVELCGRLLRVEDAGYDKGQMEV